MEFKELQNKIIETAMEYGELQGISIDEEFVMLKLTEEVGEFNQALLTKKGKCREVKRVSEDQAHENLSIELADVAGMALLCAHVLEIDLEEAIERKWIKKEFHDKTSRN